MKRKKSSRMRGKRTYGYGSQKKHRGHGSKGGKGYAGSFKHKRVYLRKYEPEHFEKRKFKSLRGRGMIPTLQTLNLRDLTGTAIELPGYKILGQGTPPKGIVVKAAAFSEKAKEKIAAAGGKAETL